MLIRNHLLMRNPHGITLRAATDLCRIAKKYSAQVTLLADNSSADVSSAFRLMRLHLKAGDDVVVSATGKDANQALNAICTFPEVYNHPGLHLYKKSGGGKSASGDNISTPRAA